jgi:hypothetical protein
VLQPWTQSAPTPDALPQKRILLPDDMVLDVAINGNADAIVTNNTKHFRDAASAFTWKCWLLPSY